MYPERYNYILLKELVHHIAPEDMTPMFTGIRQQLLDGGIALTITRPQEVDYPLFHRAREIWKDNQPSLDLLVSSMQAAGLQVEVHEKLFPVKMAKSAWLSMVTNKFWSTFSLCSQEELDAGIVELEKQYTGIEELTFQDKLLFITAKKISE